MKKLLILPFLLIFTLWAYAVDIPNRSIYIEGTARQPAQRQFFMDNFKMEAGALGFTVATDKGTAGFVFKFDVQPYTDEDNPSIKNIILITLIYNEVDMEMVSFGWPFGELEDMYEYNQYVFYKAAVLIPSLSDEDLAELAALANQASQAQAAGPRRGAPVSTAAADNSWQNQWVYIRVSVDYPVNFFNLNGVDKVWGGTAEPTEPPSPSNPDGIGYVIPLEQKIFPVFGATLGVEVQPLSLLSVELNAKVTMGDPLDPAFLNFALGAEIKFNLKLPHLMIQPYGTFIYHLTYNPNTFSEFPWYSFGGGIQICSGLARTGMLFFNVSYLMSLEKTSMINPFAGAKYDWAPNPETIPYNRFIVGFSVGYKYGVFDRK